MNNKLQIINEQEVLGKDFKIYGTFEEPLFLAKDVAEWIDYSKVAGKYKVSQMLSTIDPDEKVLNIIDTTSVSDTYNVDTSSKARKTQEMWFVTEDGLYEILMLSRKPIAKQFKSKVKKILKELRVGRVRIERTIPEEELKLRTEEVRAAKANIWLQLKAGYTGKSEKYAQICDAYASEALTGEFVLPLPKAERKTYSATDIGKMFNVSSRQIGIIAKEHNLKTAEYGEWYVNKSQYSDKQVDSFRYYDNAIDIFRNYIA